MIEPVYVEDSVFELSTVLIPLINLETLENNPVEVENTDIFFEGDPSKGVKSIGNYNEMFNGDYEWVDTYDRNDDLDAELTSEIEKTIKKYRNAVVENEKTEIILYEEYLATLLYSKYGTEEIEKEIDHLFSSRAMVYNYEKDKDNDKFVDNDLNCEAELSDYLTVDGEPISQVSLEEMTVEEFARTYGDIDENGNSSVVIKNKNCEVEIDM